MKEKQIQELGFRSFSTVVNRDAYAGTKFEGLRALVYGDTVSNNGLYTLGSDLTSWSKIDAKSFDFYVNDNIDTTSAPAFFIGPISGISSDTFDEIDSYSFETKLDAAGSWDAVADDTALTAWVATNVLTSNTKWRLRVITSYGVGKSGDCVVKLSYT